MAKPATRFYNMLIHIIKNNKLFEENVAIKNIWQKEGNTFLDIYFYRNQKSYIFDAIFVRDILDLSNEKYYKKVQNFVDDFLSYEEKTEKETTLNIDKNIFQPIYIDLVIMCFVAKCCNDYNIIKKRIIFDYITSHVLSSANLAYQYIDCYIDDLHPSELEFYDALKKLKSKTQEDVEILSRELLKICLADGELVYIEKMYLAEFLQVLREQGARLDLEI